MSMPINSLEPPDSHHLSAAIGWLELGNWQESNEELEKIAPTFRVHPDALEIRWLIYSRAKKWDMCLDIPEGLDDPLQPGVLLRPTGASG
jgi:hypothetical protein